MKTKNKDIENKTIALQTKMKFLLSFMKSSYI